MTFKTVVAVVGILVAWFIGWTWNMPADQYRDIAGVIVGLLSFLVLVVCIGYVVFGD